MSNNELFKTIETQGRLITELRDKNEQLKWKAGNIVVDLREENEKIRMQFDEFKVLSERLVEYIEPHEEEHYEECVASDIDVSDHIMNVIKNLKTIIK